MYTNTYFTSLTLSSSRLKPLPARTFVWYLMVGHLTIGLIGPETGLGATRRALAWRALRLFGEELRVQAKFNQSSSTTGTSTNTSHDSYITYTNAVPPENPYNAILLYARLPMHRQIEQSFTLHTPGLQSSDKKGSNVVSSQKLQRFRRMCHHLAVDLDHIHSVNPHSSSYSMPLDLPADLSSGLVKPGGYSSLPVLVEVRLQNHAIPAGGHGDLIPKWQMFQNHQYNTRTHSQINAIV